MELSGVEVLARGVSVRGSLGPVFENLDLDVPAGGLLAVHGPRGSGRTAVLLTLGGRMRMVAGAVQVGGYRLPRRAGKVRRLVAVARAAPAVVLEDRLRVSELISERTAVDRVKRPQIDEMLSFLDVDLPGHPLLEELAPDDAFRLALALALARGPSAVIADDVDEGCTPAQSARAWQALAAVCSTGCTVLAASTAPPDPAYFGHGVASPTVVTVALPRHSASRLAPPTSDDDRGGDDWSPSTAPTVSVRSADDPNAASGSEGRPRP